MCMFHNKMVSSVWLLLIVRLSEQKPDHIFSMYIYTQCGCKPCMLYVVFHSIFVRARVYN